MKRGDERDPISIFKIKRTCLLLRRQLLRLNFGTLHFDVHCHGWEHLYGRHPPRWQAAPLWRLQVALKIQARYFLSLEEDNFSAAMFEEIKLPSVKAALIPQRQVCLRPPQRVARRWKLGPELRRGTRWGSGARARRLGTLRDTVRR